MVLWTVMPMEIILSQEYQPNYEEIEYAGTKMMVEKTANNEYRVVRILSTDPQDYLRNDIQPGAVLSYEPIL
ncbi:hypothetical protein SPSIL_023740 [Sporomusa silvacetica DSM 10669]|uniref:YlzJ-like protein n=1 Tax=Sporomusa silvacetica DSM 10669 TaxID=1123289 RepID=A0ABZ3ILC8_9FIRM|nr:YlzJ-like family protein [Sporomusa silvacetica]OZC13465.1 hypothetical protein SPSIL_53930 [Sporomusa silvacetica DSM 10669]